MTIVDIQTEARDLVDATSTSYTDALLLIRENTAIEEIVDRILTADGRWQFDDANNVDYPGGVAVVSTLSNGVANYAIDTTLIEVLGVSIKDKNGNFYKLLPFDPEDLKSSYGPYLDQSQFLNTSGRPLYYDVHGSYVSLYPAPDNNVSVTLTSGMKIYGTRTAQLFTSAEVSTGTKAPGFASPFHSLIAYKAALPYAQKFKPARVQFFMTEIQRKTAELVDFYSRRNQDERPIITMKPVRPYR